MRLLIKMNRLFLSSLIFRHVLILVNGTVLEERRQKVGESGIEYALDKQNLLLVSPIPLNDQQMVSFLIEGLAN